MGDAWQSLNIFGCSFSQIFFRGFSYEDILLLKFQIIFTVTSDGKQHYRYTVLDCPRQSFILDYSNLGCLPEVKNKIIEMTMNGSYGTDVKH